MNVNITVDTAKLQKSVETNFNTTAESIKVQLDDAFRSGIDTPESVYRVFGLLMQYRHLSGKNYKMTFEEDSIV